MKGKNFKKTTAKLPDDEMIIGGDAPSGSENKDRKKEMKKLIEKVEKKQFKSKKK